MKTKTMAKPRKQPENGKEGAGVPAVVEQTQLPTKTETKTEPIVSIEVDPYRGVSSVPVTTKAQEMLLAPLDPNDVEVRPDGIVFLPEIKYRRILNRSFGPGGWALVPRSEIDMSENIMSREYALFVNGRFISESRGEQEYFPNNPNMTYPSATEGVKSNALMRCCKDLGIASELWDPGYIVNWQKQHAVRVWRRESKDRKPQWRRKDRDPFWDETGIVDGKPPQAKPAPTGAQWPQSEGGPPEEPAQTVPRGTQHERTAAHNHLEQTVEAYCKANNIDPKVEGLTILERMSAYVTRDGRKHPGVRDVLLLSEKEAIICRCLIEDTIERNRNWRVELGQAIIKYCEDKKVTKEEVLEKCSGKRTIRDLDQPTAKKAFEKFQELYLRE